MLDYYGSITFSRDEALADLKVFLDKSYKETYVQKLLDELKYDIPEKMSVSGWRVFHQKGVLDKINALIERDTRKALLRLETAKVFFHENTLLTDTDIIQKIAHINC